jgi:hypothetical protein
VADKICQLVACSMEHNQNQTSFFGSSEESTSYQEYAIDVLTSVFPQDLD